MFCFTEQLKCFNSLKQKVENNNRESRLPRLKPHSLDMFHTYKAS